MHKYFRRCRSRRGGRIHRGDFRLRGELVSLITVSVHEYDCRATVARRAAARKLAWRHRLLLLLMNLCICILQRGSRHPEEEEEESSSPPALAPASLPFGTPRYPRTMSRIRGGPAAGWARRLPALLRFIRSLTTSYTDNVAIKYFCLPLASTPSSLYARCYIPRRFFCTARFPDAQAWREMLGGLQTFLVRHNIEHLEFGIFDSLDSRLLHTSLFLYKSLRIECSTRYRFVSM